MIRILLAIGVFGSLVSCVNPKTKVAHTEKPGSKPEWQHVSSPTKAHLRGLDLAPDGTIWASGTDGVVLKSQDSGKTWTSVQVPECPGVDFRDVEGFNEDRAVVMSSGNGVKLYYTKDGATTWRLSYEDTNSTVFFDGIDFNQSRGLAYGDPQDGKLAILETRDSGVTWMEMSREPMPFTLEGEAGFAASGTGIVLGKSAMWIATGGGAKSRVFRASADSSWTAVDSPLASAPSSGIFSMAFCNDEQGIVVGGDYVDSTRNTRNAAYTEDGGINWVEPKTNPSGYRSCVVFSGDGNVAIATGRSGTDYSIDQGENWNSLSSEGYFSCVILGNYLIGVGRKGKIGRMDVSALRTIVSRD